MRYKFIRTI